MICTSAFSVDMSGFCGLGFTESNKAGTSLYV